MRFIERHSFMETELQTLIEVQAKDMRSWHVSKDGREITINPAILDAMEDNGLEYDEYHGWVRQDAI